MLSGCSTDDDSDNRTWELGSIVGEWVFEHNEIFEDGVLVETNRATDPADKCVAIFNANGTLRYYDFPPEEYYDGTYTFDEQSGRLPWTAMVLRSHFPVIRCGGHTTKRRDT